MLMQTIGNPWLGHGSAGPRAHFLNNENGVLLDFTDPRTLYQDEAGVTALTAPEQTMGLAGDKSRVRIPLTSHAASQANSGLCPKWGRAPVSRRNLVPYSEQFDNAAWQKTSATVTPNAAVAPDGTMTADKLVVNTGVSQQHYMATASSLSSTLADNTLYTMSIYGKAGEYSMLAFSCRRKDSSFAVATFNLSTGLISGVSNAVSTGAIDLGGGWWRCVMTINAMSGAGAVYPGVGSTFASFVGDGASGVCIWGFQFEPGSVATPYQRVASLFDVTEAGVPSYGFLRPDLSDDKLTVTFPSALSGDLLIHGRKGSWIEPVAVSAGGTFDLGPTGTVVTPGILRAVGDIVGVEIIGRTLNAAERALALAYWRTRGAAGWLVASGAELVPNGTVTTDTTGWSVNAAGTIASTAGQLVLTCVSPTPVTGTSFTTVIGRAYLISVTFVADAMTGSAFTYVGTTITNGSILVHSMGNTVGTYIYAFVATAATTWISLVGSASALATETMTFDNVSCKELTAS